MVDTVDSATRSRMMAGIRGKDTKPERVLRQRLHAAGIRFRLHAPGLPGKPDLVFPRYKAVAFVHGCFWHRHEGCHWCTTPASNAEFWQQKFDRNVVRDGAAIDALHRAGWRVAVAWECGLRGSGADDLADRIADWLRNGAGDFDSGLVRRRAEGNATPG
ncbi:very short patch repair endonuclease [Sphingobium nicotianae]|uniref:DNA mismatch endonuclease Vsr n=1 Tax=Sphingobium nicotianae TaxID=2782607 RepID=A0A9X1DFI1_9SPHN|nr:very short patch repair endonuclease [Sphingobium nicotianae]MBT2189295.1 DNA mismatch endonuclease Vsr [Sphingobium nicotianae]